MSITSNFSKSCDVAVIGAGPYGLAVAAHLRAANIDSRIFGDAMSFWRQNMPAGMKLRSPWIATHIAEPLNRYRLDDYFEENGLPIPELLPIENFIGYGTWFQERVAPDIDKRAVTQVAAADGGFHLTLDSGEMLAARRVVVATGLRNHEYRPAEFNELSRDLVSHSCDHAKLDRFRGLNIAVIGRGQSACESAALLKEAGANAEIFCHGGLQWNSDPDTRGTLRKAIRSLIGPALIPPSQVGPFPHNWLVEAPGIIRHLPQHLRDSFSDHCLRATAILWLRSRLHGIPVHQGSRIVQAQQVGDGVALTTNHGSRRVDHVLLATGYRIDVDKVAILGARLREGISRHRGLPVLSSGFESSVPGLYFAGAHAVGSFGPLLRFIAGAGFAGQRITQSVRGRRAAMHRTVAANLGLAPQEAAIVAAEQNRA